MHGRSVRLVQIGAALAALLAWLALGVSASPAQSLHTGAPRSTVQTGAWRQVSLHAHLNLAQPGHSLLAHPGSPLGITSAAASGKSLNWAGPVATGRKFSAAYLNWTVPRLNVTGVARYVAVWPGVGSGANGAQLVQAGVLARSTPRSVTYGWWFEVFPDDPYAFDVTGLPLAAGNQVSVQVTVSAVQGNSFHSTFTFQNVTDHTEGSLTVSNQGRVDHQAEAILERPTVPGGLPALAKFGRLAVARATMSSPGAACPGTLHTTLISMEDVLGRALAQVSGFSGSGCTFQFTRIAND